MRLFFFSRFIGSDSSKLPQSKTTPWRHRPGSVRATGLAACYLPQPGDLIVELAEPEYL